MAIINCGHVFCCDAVSICSVSFYMSLLSKKRREPLGFHSKDWFCNIFIRFVRIDFNIICGYRIFKIRLRNRFIYICTFFVVLSVTFYIMHALIIFNSSNSFSLVLTDTFLPPLVMSSESITYRYVSWSASRSSIILAVCWWTRILQGFSKIMTLM